MPAPETAQVGSALAALVTAVVGTGDYMTAAAAVRQHWSHVSTDRLLDAATGMTLAAGAMIRDLVDPTEEPQVTADWVRASAVEHLEQIDPEPEAQP